MFIASIRPCMYFIVSLVSYPLETYTILIPFFLAKIAISCAYSLNMVGSLYVKAIEGIFRSTQISTTCFGDKSSLFLLIIPIIVSNWFKGDLRCASLVVWEIVQFWQNSHPKLQPNVPMDSICVP